MSNEEPSYSNNWREYQRRLQRSTRRRYVRSRLPVLAVYGVAAFSLIATVAFAGPWLYTHLSRKPPFQELAETPVDEGPGRLIRRDLPSILGPVHSGGIPDVTAFTVETGGRRLRVETTLDAELQSYIEDLLGRSLTYRAAVVVMSPVDGRILALAGYSETGRVSGKSLCLRADYPAASLFKIVVAAAAVEAKSFQPERNLTYEGRRYTLYKKQLIQKKKGRYTNEITFRRAFSSSINPVFGKIGIYHLGQDLLDRYSRKFLFNEPIPMELPLDPSRIEVPSDDFGLAEIASGFNKRTLISPVHACMITAAVANNGTMMMPWLVRRIRDAEGHEIYRADIEPLATPITEATAGIMKSLMEDTIINGTCRRTFRTLRSKKAFQDMDMGAKTGTINDREDRYKFDWLSAYVLPRDERSPICMTVLAVHGKKLGIRAKNLARYIIEHRY